MKIELATAFQNGQLNSDLFKDIPFLSDQELQAIFQFMQEVSAEIEQEGKNKPSWKADNMADLPNTQLYKENQLWHYHCGPYIEESGKIYQKTVQLTKNLKGKTSSAVIHYQKIAPNHIFIIGFSPKHIPFPKATALLNPLIMRATK